MRYPLGVSDFSPTPPRRAPSTETVAAPDDVTDYLRKRHTSEGPGRRRIAHSTRDPALASLSDAELDDRNVRVWAVVQESCQLMFGLDPTANPDLRARATIRDMLLRTAQKAALCICYDRYGIPVTRLAPIAGHDRGWISVQVATPNTDTLGLIRRWSASAGPSRVSSAAELVTVQITEEAALALAKMSAGQDPVSFLSSLILRG